MDVKGLDLRIDSKTLLTLSTQLYSDREDRRPCERDQPQTRPEDMRTRTIK